MQAEDQIAHDKVSDDIRVENNKTYLLEEAAMNGCIAEGLLESFHDENFDPNVARLEKKQSLFIVYPGEQGEVFLDSNKLLKEVISPVFDVKWMEIKISQVGEQTPNAEENVKSKEIYQAYLDSESTMRELLRSKVKHLAFFVCVEQTAYEGNRITAALNLFEKAIQCCENIINEYSKKKGTLCAEIDENMKNAGEEWRISIVVVDSLQAHNHAFDRQDKERLKAIYREKGKKWYEEECSKFEKLIKIPDQKINIKLKFIFWDELLLRGKSRFNFNRNHGHLLSAHEGKTKENRASAYYYTVYLKGLEFTARQIKKKAEAEIKRFGKIELEYDSPNTSLHEKVTLERYKERAESLDKSVGMMKHKLKVNINEFYKKLEQLELLAKNIYKTEEMFFRYLKSDRKKNDGIIDQFLSQSNSEERGLTKTGAGDNAKKRSPPEENSNRLIGSNDPNTAAKNIRDQLSRLRSLALNINHEYEQAEYNAEDGLFNCPEFNVALNVPREIIINEMIVHFFLESAQSKQSKITILHGMGGIGKTHLASEYFVQKNPYILRVWLNAYSESSLKKDYLRLGQKLQLFDESVDRDTAIARIKSWFENTSGWLLVFDDVEDGKLLSKYLPSHSGHIIITSRQQNIINNEQVLNIEVNCMSKSEAIELLKLYSKRAAEDFSELAVELDYLPLALEMAGAYLKNHPDISVENYLKMYKVKFTELMGDKSLVVNSPGHRKKVVETTFKISIKHHDRQKMEMAEGLLGFCAYLDPSAISISILKSWVLNEYYREINADPYLFREIIDYLVTHSLLKVEPAQNMVSIHPVIQEVMRNQIKKANDLDGYVNRGWSLLEYSGDSNGHTFHYIIKMTEVLNHAFYKCMERDINSAASYQPHLEKALENLIDHKTPEGLSYIFSTYHTLIKLKCMIDIIGCLAFLSRTFNRKYKAQGILLISLRIVEANVPREPLFNNANTLTTIGKCYIQIGNFSHGVEVLEKAENKLEAELDDRNYDKTISYLIALSDVYQAEVKNQNKAESLLKRALELYESKSIEKNWWWVHVVLRLCRIQYDYQKNKALLAQAVVVLEKHNPEELGLKYAILSLLEAVVTDIKERISVLENKINVEKLQSKSLSDKGVKASTLFKLGECYFIQGDFVKAIRCLESIKNIYRRIRRAEHIDEDKLDCLLQECYLKMQLRKDFLELQYIWNRSKAQQLSLIESILEILKFYTRNNSLIGRALCGNWGRRHVSAIEALINAVENVLRGGVLSDDNNDLVVFWILTTLRDMPLNNIQGTLSTIIYFLNKNLKSITDPEDINHQFEEVSLYCNDTIPSEFKCPLSRKLMKNPVKDEFGFNFERMEINKHRAQFRWCPCNCRSYTIKNEEEFSIDYELHLKITLFVCKSYAKLQGVPVEQREIHDKDKREVIMRNHLENKLDELRPSSKLK